MNIPVTEITHFPIPLPMGSVKRRLKIPPAADFRDYDAMIERFFPLVETRARFGHMDMVWSEEKVAMGDGREIISAGLSRHLKNCRKVSLIGVTIGPFIEEEIEKYQSRGKTLPVMILDALGSECVEQAAIYVSGLIGDEVKKNRCVPTRRFSPGYGDLPLEIQRYFFNRLQLDEIGMALNPSLLMVPQKSITAFIGWRESIRP